MEKGEKKEGQNGRRKEGRQLTGISGVSKTYFGTCLALNSLLISALTSLTKLSVNFSPGFINKNNITLSSSSCGLLCPTQMLSLICGNLFSIAEYISAEPNRTPEGFKTPSARPR